MKTKHALYNGEQILPTVLMANHFSTRLKGLMFSKSLDGKTGLLLRPCSQIHTYFMNYCIDAVFLDGKGKIIRIETEIPPSRITPYVSGSRQVLELNAGKSKLLGLEAGGRISFI